MEDGLMTLSAVAAEFDVSRVTVSDLVSKLGLTTKRMTNNKAKGLDRRDRRIIARALRPARTTA